MKNSSSLLNILIFSLLLQSCQNHGTTSDPLSTATETEKILVDDMILEKDFIQQIQNENDISTLAAGGYSVYGSQPWKKGIVPIVFSPSITASQKDWFIKVAQKWSPNTGVSIVNRTNQSDYLYVNSTESGCFSDVGARPGQSRTLNLGSGCWTEAITLHELGHALGLMHEHQRPDRNSFIRIDLNNADPALYYAFELFSTMNNSTPYDFYSIMHYSQYAFSKNKKPTMNTLPKYAAYQNVMGIKKISDQDRKSVAAMYAQTIASGK